jgi:hypothetical protein
MAFLPKAFVVTADAALVAALGRSRVHAER